MQKEIVNLYHFLYHIILAVFSNKVLFWFDFWDILEIRNYFEVWKTIRQLFANDASNMKFSQLSADFADSSSKSAELVEISGLCRFFIFLS